MANSRIREAAARSGVRLWQIAAKLNLNDGNFSRKLRVELPDDEQEKILEIISKLSEEVKE